MTITNDQIKQWRELRNNVENGDRYNNPNGVLAAELLYHQKSWEAMPLLMDELQAANAREANKCKMCNVVAAVRALQSKFYICSEDIQMVIDAVKDLDKAGDENG